MVRPGRSKDLDHAAQRGLCARAHVQRLAGQPHGLHSNHRKTSRLHCAKSPAALTGQVMFSTTAPRHNSMRMSAGVATGQIGTANASAMNSPVLAASQDLSSRASCLQRCTTLALTPCAIATLATDAPGSLHAATTWAFVAALYRRRVSVFSLVIVST